MAAEKKGINDYLDALIDKEGLRTEVTVTLTNTTLLKVVGSLVIAGAGIALAGHLLKNVIVNDQLAESNRLLTEINKHLGK